MTYNVFSGTLNPTQSINQSISLAPADNIQTLPGLIVMTSSGLTDDVIDSLVNPFQSASENSHVRNNDQSKLKYRYLIFIKSIQSMYDEYMQVVVKL